MSSLPTPPRTAPEASEPSDALRAFWALPVEDVLSAVGSSAAGVSASEAEKRLAEHGPNAVAVRGRARGVRLLLAQFTSPIVLILIGATILSLALGDVADSLIILAIVVASGLLSFWQEHTAGRAVDALAAQVRATVRVVRDGAEKELPVEDVTLGDVVALVPGTVIPADCRVITSEGMVLDEAALTGESYPATKRPDAVSADAPLGKRKSAVFMGSHVVSGSGTAVVVRLARDSEFGRLSQSLAGEGIVTSFERGATRFGVLLVRAILLLLAAVFAVNLLLHRPWLDAFMFSLALAVGLTPQLLPAIVAVSLAKGAKRMAAEKVIVKRLDAIEDFGSMTVLCTDKTGTITEGSIRLDSALDLFGKRSGEVLRLAYLNAALQRGFPNPIDLAIQAEAGELDGAQFVAEVPYDFTRKRLSVLVADSGRKLLITKGAASQVLAVCSRAAADGGTDAALATVREDVDALIERLSADGFRVLGLATREMPAGAEAVSADDEVEMTFRGLLAFADPPKPGAAEALKDLSALGISVCAITGDSKLAALHTATAVGLPVDRVLTGAEVESMSDNELREALAVARVVAEVEPLHKERIVRALRDAGESVGFLGDGINDAAALHAADVGISVDTAVDVAKQSAAIVLLDKSLSVVCDGVTLGRQTFANTLKYVRVTISANFGNVISMAIASAFLPWLPLLPTQILLLNFLSDMPAVTIATDNVDREATQCPERWNVASIRRFMISFGLLSSVFDIITFLVMRLGFHASATLFRSGWFIESTITELAAMLVLRTVHRFYQSRPSQALALSSLAVFAVTIAIPYSPFASALKLDAIPWPLLAVLALLTLAYVAANEVMKNVITNWAD